MKESVEKFVALLERFGNAVPQAINSAKDLATIMAGKARLLASTIEKALTADSATERDSDLCGQMAAFDKVLIRDIKPDMFADIYAQTIVYGMFAARLHSTSPKNFSRNEAATLIPKTNPFLCKMFQYIAGYDVDNRIAWIIDDLVAAFQVTDVDEVMAGYGKRTAQTDPFLHFYEDFLAVYNPDLRKQRGVWYTPSAVVSYIVRAVDEILVRDFGIKDGLACTAKIKSPKRDFHKVQILDPATGTGTFLAEVVQTIHAKMAQQKGAWQNYVTEHLLPRLHGFELLMAPYAMAHLKLEMQLTETGYSAETNRRLGIYLTNSLEEYHDEIGPLFVQELAKEANAASRIKRDTPVMVIIGNPPYSGESANKGEWITRLMESYKKEPNTDQRLNERNPKWINDDYVKFIRLGQEFVDRNSEGVLAYINNHSFLDNPTFRGMRWQLLRGFDKIYIIDLHGNSKKKDTTPDGGKDENVFNIQQGVSINFFIKTGKKKAGELAEVYHCDLFGKREDKYDFLTDNNLQSMPFRKLTPNEPNYFFVPKNENYRDEYESGFSVNDLFLVNGTGIVTARDHFTIHHTAKDVENTIAEFLTMDNETARSNFELGKDVRDWQVEYARKDLQKNYPNPEKTVKISYRPFDERFTFYTGNSKGFHCMPRANVMRHFLAGENVGLVAARQCVGDWRHVFITGKICEFNLTGTAGRFGSGNVFPLYHYPAGENVGLVFRRQQPTNRDLYLFISKNIIADGYIRSDNKGGESVAPLYVYPASDTHFGDTSAIPNLKPVIVNAIAEKINESFTPLDLFDYIYGVLHSPAYRERYKEFLKTDFPRVPYPKDATAFWHFAKFGGELRLVHLLEHESLDTLNTCYTVEGDNIVTNVKYVDDKVYINATQFFGNVQQAAWDFYIGGYQPAQKWLKDRKNRTLTYDDILHYRRILAALALTEKLMKEIDATK